MRFNRGGGSFAPYLLSILVLVGLVLLFFGKMAFSNLILARGDTFLYFYPYWNAAANALQEGRIPFWNPNIFMGAPLLANSQVGFFYPFNWPFWWFLDTPYAVSASIIFHLVVAGLGTYFAGLRVMGLQRSASLLAAVSFALGGYLTAQVEHVNQLQGLSWLPWFLVAVEFGMSRNRRNRLISMLTIALLFSLQLLAGHTQTTFITGVGLAVWILARLLERRLVHEETSQVDIHGTSSYISPFIILITGALLALIVAAIQILPTFELSQLSSRQGGLPANEVLSFSLPPLLISRTLLPAFGQSLFTEYVAFLPLVVLALAFVGAWQWRRRTRVLPALAWTVVGYWLALGAYNPFYWILARLPGFNLFRAPARWMVLYALGVSLLAGIGWQLILKQISKSEKTDEKGENQDSPSSTIIRPLQIFLIAILLLFAWAVVGQYLTTIIPTGPESPYEAPHLSTILLWGVEWFVLAAVLITLSRQRFEKWWRWVPWLIIVTGISVLFIGSRTLPYNNLTTPKAYFDLRPPISRLQVESNGTTDRFLSLSDIFFDLGDQAEIDTVYEDQLPIAAQYDYTIAVKQKEIVAPNLPMVFGLSTVDGFDGGILPLQSYSQLMKLILPDGTETTDGRLRENLSEIPENRWLDLFGARYLITDKVGDLWREGIFFDRQHAIEIQEGEAISVSYLPDFEATDIRLLASQLPGLLHIVTIDGESWELAPEKIDEGLFGAALPTPAKLEELEVSQCPELGDCVLEALTLVDDRDGTFQALVPGEYRLIYSGDVKIYDNLDVMPRAFIVYDWQQTTDITSAINIMRSTDFDVRNSAVLITSEVLPVESQPQDTNTVGGYVEIESYSPERVSLISNAAKDGLLVLTDSYYPGWEASVDGQNVPIQRANGQFRGVFVPAGQHEVVFDLDPQSYNYGRAISLVGLAVILILMVIWIGTKTTDDALAPNEIDN